MDRLVFAIYRAVAKLVCLLPLETGFRFGSMLGGIVWFIAGKYRRLALHNLGIAFADEKTEAQLRSIGHGHFRLLGGNLFASLKLPTLSREQLEAVITIEGLEHMDAQLAKNGGFVFVISHLGNWEMFGQITPFAFRCKVGTIYQALGNPFIDAAVRRDRARLGLALFERKEGFTQAAKFLREGGAVGVLIDQHAGDAGLWCPFFGRLASTTTLAATLAQRSGAVLIAAAVHTAGVARWRVVLRPEIAANGESPAAITTRLNLVLEEQIRENPSDWFWVHNRWKLPRPKFLLATYKRGIAYPPGFGPGTPARGFRPQPACHSEERRTSDHFSGAGENRQRSFVPQDDIVEENDRECEMRGPIRVVHTRPKPVMLRNEASLIISGADVENCQSSFVPQDDTVEEVRGKSEMRGPKPFRIVIRGSNWLGDAVMSIPAVRAIKRGRPDAHVTILTPAKLADLWRAIPEVDDIISIEPGESVFRVAKKLRSSRAKARSAAVEEPGSMEDRRSSTKAAPFDAAIIFPNSLRTALEPWLAGIPRRVGYPGHRRSWLLNQVWREKKSKKQHPQPPRHQVHDYLALVEFIGAAVEAGSVNSDRRIEDGKSPATIHRSPVTIHQPKLRFGLCPGAEYGPAKRWLSERFAETMRRVHAETDCEWRIFGVAKDRSVVDEILTAAPGVPVVDRVGKTTLAELIAELRECDLLLTNDTGTMHLAAIFDVPVVAIFGSTEPRLTGPLGAGHTILRHHVPCSPCFLRDCPIDFRCMKAVEVEEVVAAILRRARETSHPESGVEISP